MMKVLSISKTTGRRSCITLVLLPVEIDPNLGDQRQTRNVENPNENGHNETRLNLREKPRQDCKTFIHRFDSDRRLQLTNTLNSLRARPALGFFSSESLLGQ
jgi:hypothetical protein